MPPGIEPQEASETTPSDMVKLPCFRCATARLRPEMEEIDANSPEYVRRRDTRPWYSRSGRDVVFVDSGLGFIMLHMGGSGRDLASAWESGERAGEGAGRISREHRRRSRQAVCNIVRAAHRPASSR